LAWSKKERKERPVECVPGIQKKTNGLSLELTVENNEQESRRSSEQLVKQMAVKVSEQTANNQQEARWPFECVLGNEERSVSACRTE